MIGRGFSWLGTPGSARFMASDGSRGGLPPLPIVDDTATTMRYLEREHARVARKEATCFMMLARPDNLAEGDAAQAIVAAIGERLSYGLRPYDSLHRFGADMFLIVLSHIKPEDTRTVMNRLRGVVSDKLLTLPGDNVVPATASFGGLMIDSDMSIEDNLDCAGRALHAASQNGGDNVCVYS